MCYPQLKRSNQRVVRFCAIEKQMQLGFENLRLQNRRKISFRLTHGGTSRFHVKDSGF